MNCPHCAAPIGEHVTEYGDHACAACGLAGPREVLEALAARLAPASVLAEAERLLREALPMQRSADVGIQVVLWGDGGATLRKPLPGSGYAFAATLAEAYEKLTKGDAHG